MKIDGKEYQEIYFVWEGTIDHLRTNEKKCYERVSCVGIFSTKKQAIEGMKKAYTYYKNDNNNIVGELEEGREIFYPEEEINPPYSFHSFGFDMEYKEGMYSYSECGYTIEKTCLNKLNIFDLCPEDI